MNHDLVNQHFDLVHVVAERVKRKLPRYVYYDDLVSAGGEGLMQASDSYNPNEGVKFQTYAAHRIKGAMYDWFRQAIGKRSKETRRKIKLVGLEQVTDDVRCTLVVKDQEWHKDAVYYRYEPTTVIGRMEREKLIKQAASLGTRHRHNDYGSALLDLYYWQNASMRTIANELMLSESRISQVHSYLIARYAVMLATGILSYDLFYA